MWQVPKYAAWFHGLASAADNLHDRRGIGASSRDVDAPNLETRVADLGAVLDAVGSERPVLGGQFEGGATNVLFAATFPSGCARCSGGTPRRERPMPTTTRGVAPSTTSSRMLDIVEHWGTDNYNEPDDPSVPWGLLSRQSATPDVAIQYE